MTLTTVKGSVLNRGVNVKDFGAVGDGVTDDTTAFEAAILNCETGSQKRLHIPEGHYRLTKRLTVNKTFDITCETTAALRWDVVSPTVNDVGIFFDFEGGGDTLARIELPQLFSSAISSGFSIPGYNSGAGWNYDISTRIGHAIHVKGSNRLDIYVHYAAGWAAAAYFESTPSSTVDNIDCRFNVIDFCEKGLHLHTDTLGFSQFVFTVNTVWAKYPLYFDGSSGYVRGSYFHVTGTAFMNEMGGSIIYNDGVAPDTSTIIINEAVSGERSDSPTNAQGTGLVSPFIAGNQISDTLSGTAQSGAAGTITLAAATYYFDDAFNESQIKITGGTGAGGDLYTISDYVQSTKLVTISGSWLNGTPDNTSTYEIYIKYDGYPDQTDTKLGYFDGNHNKIRIGTSFNSIIDEGGSSPIPATGDTIRIRDAGEKNDIVMDYAINDSGATIPLSTTIGEANFNGGIGGAPFAKCVKCSAVLSSLAAGSGTNFHFYHQMLGHRYDKVLMIAPLNETMLDNDIEAVAFHDTDINRHAYVRFRNRGSGAYSGTVYFWIVVAG